MHSLRYRGVLCTLTRPESTHGLCVTFRWGASTPLNNKLRSSPPFLSLSSSVPRSPRFSLLRHRRAILCYPSYVMYEREAREFLPCVPRLRKKGAIAAPPVYCELTNTVNSLGRYREPGYSAPVIGIALPCV